MSTEPLRGSDAIPVRELADMRSAGKEHTVFDVREARELDICRLEGALQALSRQMSIGHFRAQNLSRAVTIHEQKQWSSTVSRRANRQYRI